MAWEIHRRATEHHLPYGITQCNLPPNADEHAPHLPQTDKSVLNLPTYVGWKAELTLALGNTPRWFTCPQTVTHPSSNQLIATGSRTLKL